MPSPRFLLASLAVAGLTLSGCAKPGVHDYRELYGNGVSAHVASVAVVRPVEGAPLSRDEEADLNRLNQEYLRRPAGPVTVTVAAAPGDVDGAEAFARSLADRVGVAPDQTKVVLSTSGAVAPGTALVEVPVWVAETPKCGTFSKYPNPDFDNSVTSGFGCSYQHNLGAMVANPGDLVQMRDSTGRDGNRSADVMDKYQKGATMGSGKEVPATFSVSGVSAGAK